MPLLLSVDPASQPRAVQKTLSKDPIFRDDKLVLPLQAADMLAWHIRRRYADDPTAYAVPKQLDAVGMHMATDISARQLESIAKGFSEVPGVRSVQRRGTWKQVRREIARQIESGAVPSFRWSRWKNTVRLTLIRLRRRISRVLARGQK
jgi:hypothetical protein